VPALTRPGLDLTALAFEVREQVSRIAQNAGYDQWPAYYDGTVGGRVYLAGLPPAGPAADEVAWIILKDTGNAEQLRRFIAQYPASPRRREAEQRINALEQTNVAVTLPTRPAEKPQGPTGLAERAPAPQKVVLYEEDPANPNGTQFTGTVLWRTERVPAAGGQNSEVAIRGDIEIPQQMSVLLSLRRNDDKTLPASHTVEIVFTLPPRFSHGEMKNVPGILMKQEETARGVPLKGLAVKVTNNFFLVGLSVPDAEMQKNVQLLKEQSWFDIPVVYGDGKRAILAIEKGAPGERAFAEAFAAWEQQAVVAPPGPPAAPAASASSDEPKRVHTVPIRTDAGAKEPAAHAPAPPVESGGYVVQVTVARSEADARTAFASLQAKYSSVLSGRLPLIRPKDQGERGIYFAAQVGPFADRSKADQLCEQLKSAGGSCFVQRN
jgi:cell division septation protein DedD